MSGLGPISLVSSVVRSEGRDADLASDVELVGDGGSSGVEPVGVVGGEVLGAGGLYVSNPLFNIIIN